MMNVTDGKVVGWVGFGFGSAISIAGNVLHAWLPADPPSIAAQIGAAAWSIALLLSVEAISRVRWRDGWWWRLARFGGLGVVGLGSFAISYGHMFEVLTAWGYGLGAYIGPVVIDGLMVISGFALLSESTAGQVPQVQEKPKPRTVADVVVQPKVEKPAAEPAAEKQNVSPIRPNPAIGERAKQLMEDEGVSRATAYRRARKELEDVSA